MKFTKHISLLLAVYILGSAAVSAQTSSGKLSLSKGQKLQVDDSVVSLISQEMAGQSIEINIEANIVHQLEVKDKKKNSYLISATLTKLATKGNAMGQSMSFDSDKKEDLETEPGKAMKDQLNVPQEVELSDDGKLINGVKKDTTESAGGQLTDIVKNMTGGNGDDSNGASAAFQVMPVGKKAGDSWSDSIISNEIKTFFNYTIKDIKGKEATVLLTGKQVTSRKVEQQGMEININMEGKMSGEGIVDIDTGVLKEKTTVIDATGTAEMMGQSIPVTTKITTKTTVKKI